MSWLIVSKCDIKPLKWEPGTPAMAGLTDIVWTIEEFVFTIMVPKENNTK